MIRLQRANTFLFFALFLLFFPKGGIKIAGIPLTWGYLLLTISSIFLAFRKLHPINLNHIKIQLLFIPFQVLFIFTLFFQGIQSYSAFISLAFNLFFLPFSFFTLYSSYIDTYDKEYIFLIIKKGVLFISCYGIFLFFFKTITGNFITIPLLTTNLQDLHSMANKCIDRGYAFKLISTYNNGNLYGICVLMLLPLYRYLEKSKWKKALVKLSLVLTLSRTVWIGILFSEGLIAFSSKSKKAILTFFLQIVIICLLIFCLSLYYEIPYEFFYDATLGGRLNKIDTFNNFSFFPSIPLKWINEITYLGILENFGLIGLILFILMMLGPICIYGLKNRPYREEDKPILIGIYTYLFISLSDGAYLLIPVMAFYYFLSAFLLRKGSDRYFLDPSTEDLKDKPLNYSFFP